MKKVSAVRIAVLVGNVVIVIYLIYKLRQERWMQSVHPENLLSEAEEARQVRVS